MKAELSPLGTRLLCRAAQAPAHQVCELWAPPASSQGHRAAAGGHKAFSTTTGNHPGETRGAPDSNGGRAGSRTPHRSHEVRTHVLEIHSMTIHISGRRKPSQLSVERDWVGQCLPKTCECDLIWKWGLCRCNQVRMKSQTGMGWALNPA